MTISLRTKRLLLRPWGGDDLAAFTAMSADPVVMEFLPPLSEPGAVAAWVKRLRAHWRDHGFGCWVIELPGEASFIGIVGLAWIPYEAHFTPAVEIAWRLAARLLGPRLCYRGRAYSARLWLRRTRPDRNCCGYRAGQSAFTPGHGASRDEP